jgi:uncharacterized protein (TIRG00374 family)
MTTPETENKTNRGQLWLGVGVSLICLIFIFIFVEPAEIVDAFRHANYLYLAISGSTVVLFLTLRAVRWRFLLRNQIPFWSVFHVQNIGYMLNVFLPARLGDVARSVLVGSIPPVTIATGFSTTVVDRLIDMLFVIAVLPFALASVPTLPDWMRSGAVGTGVVALTGIVLLVIAANQRPFARKASTAIFNRIHFLNTESWVRRVDDLLKGLDVFTSIKDGLLLIGLTILVWLPIMSAYYIGMKAVGLEPTVGTAVFTFCAAALSVALPSSPGQIGVFHAGVIAALTLAGYPEPQSASFAFAYHALNMLLIPTLLGLVGLAATGATLQQVMTTTQTYLRRNKQGRVGE